MKLIRLFILVVFLSSCTDSDVFINAKKVKEHAVESGFYHNNLIFLSCKNVKGTLSYPNIKLYDSTGRALQVGNCMNALENLISIISSDTFKNIYLKEPNFENFIDSFKIVCVDNLQKPELDIKNRFYLIYHWNYGLEFLTGKQNSDTIFKIMKNSVALAKSKNIKVLYVHSPL